MGGKSRAAAESAGGPASAPELCVRISFHGPWRTANDPFCECSTSGTLRSAAAVGSRRFAAKVMLSSAAASRGSRDPTRSANVATRSVVARAVRTTWQTLEIEDVLALSAWANEFTENGRARTDLSLYGTSSSYAARSFGTVRAIPTLAGKARFLAALALPEQSYITGRHTGQVDRLRRGVREINRARERS